MSEFELPEQLDGPWHHALILTYGADIPFFENALWRQFDSRCRSKVILADGSLGEIVSSRRFDETLKVYNFDVERTKSYFANGALVYQECGGPGRDDLVTAWLRGILKDWGESRSILALPGGDPPEPVGNHKTVSTGNDMASQRRPL